ncbi:hypothetical protein A3K48_03845 [candidate division WOR-1 bacterium RIFOXYA12_FULL_52_29]|uniref:Uncharacterized protein n=1 Tax=candidate division WOR-1 bacterium RIFOXYC12_FULL_54_18 TaxID=1802584 RepID=A0A1F4T6G8_UNCSA|nr:MAG: hypothetical protein A3K44_03845 [candidate division WOR-1 bacterium RIFOXYA2_FULL_51_19]OGC17692.1 MAG: hypothetical protein A3K48_03845 [candidate division WOR-1 bacterium RIFOXYA12_FULL_52_29]OGC28109.1 MAG: hypothetical protein A3K49_03845 [candidate division WOR-1 bacterium RIFOXYC12_FULL_54_18]
MIRINLMRLVTGATRTEVDRVTRPASKVSFLFKHSFLLDESTVRQFLSFFEDFEAKYVFDRRVGQLAVCAIEDEIPHRYIARAKLIDASSEFVFGGELDYKKTGNSFEFVFSGDSGYYGWPSEPDLRLAADRLAAILRSAGCSATIKKGSDATVIVAGSATK